MREDNNNRDERDLLSDISELKRKYGVYDEAPNGDASQTAETPVEDSPDVIDVPPAAAEEPVSRADDSSSGAVKPKKRKKPLKQRFRELFPVKGDKKSEIVRKILFLAAVAALVVSGTKLVDETAQKYKQQRINRELGELVIDDSGTKTEDNSAQWAALKAQHPELAGVEFPENLNPAYALLYAKNNDFAGYITIPGTDIDYPVVQGDDNSYYLDYNFYNQKTIYGAIFADYRNDLVNLDRNTIIYGHNVHDNKTMFTQAQKYLKLEGYKESPIIEYNTPYGNYKWKIAAVFIINSLKEDDNDYIFRYIFTRTSDENFEKYIAELEKRTLYDTGVDILPDDKLLTLSTCTSIIKKGRLVVVARMVREGEEETVDVSKAAENPSIKYPQAWYDKYNKENPYVNDEKWYP